MGVGALGVGVLGVGSWELGVFRVSVTKDDLVFASAHFITFAGHRCEGLHGHNYRARVTIDGELDEESWLVFDFIELKRIMRGLSTFTNWFIVSFIQARFSSSLRNSAFGRKSPIPKRPSSTVLPSGNSRSI